MKKLALPVDGNKQPNDAIKISRVETIIWFVQLGMYLSTKRVFEWIVNDYFLIHYKFWGNSVNINVLIAQIKYF